MAAVVVVFGALWVTAGYSLAAPMKPVLVTRGETVAPLQYDAGRSSPGSVRTALWIRRPGRATADHATRCPLRYVDAMPVRETALELVQSHREVEPNLRRVIFYPDPEEREVRLVEVVEGSPSAGEVLAFRFAPDVTEGVPYPVVIVELSPAEFEQLEQGHLHLPDGWGIDGLEVLFAA